MTCEVAVLNKYAVALAADSAVTVSGGDGETRYTKGANKIFQLSHSQPVGIMIFGSAAICGMPWEVVVKAYRDEHLQRNKYDTLERYAEDFFSYIQSAVSPISPSLRASVFEAALEQTFLKLLRSIQSTESSISDVNVPLADRAARVTNFVLNVEKNVDGAPFEVPEIAAAADDALAMPPENFKNAVLLGLTNAAIDKLFDFDALVRVTIKLFFRSFEQVLGNTGVVFAGYGSLQYLPCVIEYSVPGFVGSFFLRRSRQHAEISTASPSDILPFAMTSNANSFMRGVGLDVFTQVREAFVSHSAALVRSLLGKAGVAEPADLDAQVAAAEPPFMSDWYGKVLASHYHPLKRVIASLPIEEMSHLAETLVTLESLKEKVTSPTQSVGGAVDVAVITKSEGLVWIKRKHFFKSEQNLKYVIRQQAFHQ